MTWKRRRILQSCDAMDANKAKAMLTAAAEEVGREIRVFTVPITSTSQNEGEPDDDFYEFTPDDYYRIMSTKMGDQFLKTRKIREAEAAARRARITKVGISQDMRSRLINLNPDPVVFNLAKNDLLESIQAIIRVKFPDNYVLEATFHPSETLQSLVDLLNKVMARPDLPFYLYTTPPKERIKDMSKDFYSAGFAPGAIVYFSYDLPKGRENEDGSSGPFLREDILSLNGLELGSEKVEIVETRTEEPVKVEHPPPVVPGPKQEKKATKPKWLKM